MADEFTQPPTPADFEAALAELLGSLEQERAMEGAGAAPNPKRSYVPEVGAGGYGMPYMPPVVQNRLGGPELRAGAGHSPEVDAFMEATGLPLKYGPALDMVYRVGSAGPRQVQKAERAIERFAENPTVGTAANVGTQGGMALMRPSIALPSLAVQYGDALIRDIGTDGAAQAQAPLTRNQQRQMEIERQRRSGEAETKRLQTETESRLRREEADAEAQRQLKMETERKEREEYDRAVKRAEDIRAVEEGKQRRFSDTAVGKVYDETGGAAPFALGALSGFVQRGLKPAVSHGQVLGLGAFGGAAASNLPSFADAYIVPPVENPDWRAASGYARELPPTHPRKAEWLAYAENEKLLPKLNPVRTVAKEEFTDTWPAIKRNIGGAIEGAVGAEIGMGAWGVPARLFNALGRGAKDFLTSRSSPTAISPSIPGVVVDDIPAGQNALGAPTAARQAVGPTPPGSSAVAGPSQPQGRLPAPEASPNQPSSNLPSWASEPPPGVKLPKDTYWDSNRNQPRRKDGTYVEMPKYRHPR